MRYGHFGKRSSRQYFGEKLILKKEKKMPEMILLGHNNGSL